MANMFAVREGVAADARVGIRDTGYGTRADAGQYCVNDLQTKLEKKTQASRG